MPLLAPPCGRPCSYIVLTGKRKKKRKAFEFKMLTKLGKKIIIIGLGLVKNMDHYFLPADVDGCFFELHS